MEIKTYKVDSGKAKVTMYERTDINSGRKMIRPVVADIYQHISAEEFNDPIYWITDVSTSETHTVTDVLKDFVKQYGDGKIIFLQGSGIRKVPDYDTPDEMLEYITEMIAQAQNADFYKILFSRAASHSHAYGDICIYGNEKADEWIDKNMGATGIIKSVSSSHNA